MSNSHFIHIPDLVYQRACDKTSYLTRQGFNLAAMHQYTTPEGMPTWWVLRFESDEIDANTGKKAKRIFPLHLTDSGFELKRPEFGTNGAPLYNLHLLTNYPEDVVYLVEGEACADCLVKIGLIATTWPNGAQAIGKADVHPLDLRRVVLWPDNDQQGSDAMIHARGILRTLGARVVTLDVGALALSPKGDCVDWLNRFVTSHGACEFCEIPDGHSLALQAIQNLSVVQDWAVAA